MRENTAVSQLSATTPDPKPLVEGNISAFDEDDMRERSGDDAPLMAFIIRACVEDLPREIEGLLKAIRRNRPAAALKKAHSIKGAAGTASFSALARYAEEVEQALQRNQLEDALAAAQRLPTVLHWSIIEAEKFLNDLKAAGVNLSNAQWPSD